MIGSKSDWFENLLQRKQNTQFQCLDSVFFFYSCTDVGLWSVWVGNCVVTRTKVETTEIYRIIFRHFSANLFRVSLLRTRHMQATTHKVYTLLRRKKKKENNNRNDLLRLFISRGGHAAYEWNDDSNHRSRYANDDIHRFQWTHTFHSKITMFYSQFQFVYAIYIAYTHTHTHTHMGIYRDFIGIMFSINSHDTWHKFAHFPNKFMCTL